MGVGGAGEDRALGQRARAGPCASRRGRSRQQRRGRRGGRGSRRIPRAPRRPSSRLRSPRRPARPARVRRRRSRRRRPTRARGDERRVQGGGGPQPGDSCLPLAGAPTPRRDGHGRPAHQLLRHRRRDRSCAPGCTCRSSRSPLPTSTSASGRRRPPTCVRITWPNGVLQSEFDKPADTTVTASQRLKGSCPWLFAWNGREMAFVTDVIWRSPLGLRINAQATADVLMTEDWVKVAGDQLAPRDGFYDLRITAELWETHFFDLVSLLVVDHPAGTEVFVDERFAVPPPQLQVVATGPVERLAGGARRRGPRCLRRRARARRAAPRLRGPRRLPGRDARPLRRAGAPDDAPRQGPLWLVAQGWVHPDRQLDQRRAQPGRTRAVRAGCRSRWRTPPDALRRCASGLGFPAGKDKTMLLDLAGLFPARVRGGSGCDEPGDLLGSPGMGDRTARRAPRAAPARARLRRAALPRVLRHGAGGPSAPERPRYRLAGTTPRWLDLVGYHTRFGDVRELAASRWTTATSS